MRRHRIMYQSSVGNTQFSTTADIYVLAPGHVILIEEIENRSIDRLKAAARRKRYLTDRGHQVTERCGGELVEPVGHGLSRHGGVVIIVDRESSGQRVVVRKIGLRIEAHRVVFLRGLADVDLFGQVVLRHEAVVGSVKAVIRIGEIDLVMGSDPGMVEIGKDAQTMVMERYHRRGTIARGLSWCRSAFPTHRQCNSSHPHRCDHRRNRDPAWYGDPGAYGSAPR